MNKTLRFSLVSLLMLICGSMFAQDVTLDFTTNEWGLPEGSNNKGTTEASYTNGTYTVKLTAASSGYYFNTDGYLMLGKANATLELPAFDFAVSRIEIVGRSGASASVKQNIYVGENTVSEETTGAEGTNVYDIAADYQAAGNVYVLKVTSKHNAQITTINIYKAGATVKAAAGLAFSEETIDHETGTDFTAPTFSKETTAEVTFASDNEDVATVDAEGNITLGGAEGKAVITASSEENDDYLAGTATCTVYVWHYNTYKKATAVTPGASYLIVAQRDDATYYAYPLGESKTYGYLSTGKIEGYVNEIQVKSSYDDAFTIETCGDGYSIKDSYGRYLYQKDAYNSFNLDAENGHAWAIEPQDDGTFNIKTGDYYVQFGNGTYTSFGVYNEAMDGTVLPMLFAYDAPTNGISNITDNAKRTNNAIYNIAGQRVGNDYKGIVIVNGKKMLK